MRVGAIITGAVLAAGLAPAAAQAAPNQESLFMDDNHLMYRGQAVSQRTLDELRALGVDRVRLTALWRDLAPPARPANPEDPAAYRAAALDNLDHVIAAARQRGIDVLLTVTGGAPDWASSQTLPNDRSSKPYNGIAKPSASEFGHFVAMLGRRYSGSHVDENGGGVLPRVSAWAIYNEPNQGGWLAPQWERSRGRWRPASPRIYRGLVRAATDGLRRTGHARDTVLLGETAPMGNRGGGVRSHMRPGVFLRELFCLDKRLKPLSRKAARRRGCDFAKRGRLRVTHYGHHPYAVEQPPTKPTRDCEKLTLADGKRLERILDAAARARRVKRRMPIWYTEFGYQTRPPDPYTGVSQAKQAAYLAQAEQLTRTDRRIKALTQFQLFDDPPQAGQYAPSDRRFWSNWQAGLRLADGTAKPALDAYRLPLAFSGRRLWGMVRPSAHGGPRSVRIEYRRRRSGRWREVDKARVRRHGIVRARVKRGRRGHYRLVWAGPGGPEGGYVSNTAKPTRRKLTGRDRCKPPKAKSKQRKSGKRKSKRRGGRRSK